MSIWFYWPMLSNSNCFVLFISICLLLSDKNFIYFIYLSLCFWSDNSLRLLFFCISVLGRDSLHIVLCNVLLILLLFLLLSDSLVLSEGLFYLSGLANSLILNRTFFRGLTLFYRWDYCFSVDLILFRSLLF